MLSSKISHRDPVSRALLRKERNGEPGANFGKLMAEGDGWRGLDIVCTAGPHDRPFQERHAWQSISIVLSGTFTYRRDRGPSLISPGSILLGSVGHDFECSHEHGEGDRCLSFQFDEQLFERIAREAGASRAAFNHDRLPPLRALAPLTARAAAGISRQGSLEDLAFDLAVTVLQLEGETLGNPIAVAMRDHSRVAEVLRHMEAHPEEPHTLPRLAEIAGLSRYHFLRTFKSVTGVTPHQWLLRTRLRDAARRLLSSRAPITEIALEVGFDDLSNFIRSFRTEFGISPRQYRSKSWTEVCS